MPEASFSKFLISGSRHYKPISNVRLFLTHYVTLIDAFNVDLVVGGASGVDDEAAKVWMELTGHKAIIVPAPWTVGGKGAGQARNKLMVKMVDGPVFGFWDGLSSGTKGCLDFAVKKGRITALVSSVTVRPDQTTRVDLRYWQEIQSSGYKLTV